MPHISYGSESDDLMATARRIESLLGAGEPHESLYLGGDYYLWRTSDGEVRLRPNRELEDELAIPEHPEFPLLVEVDIGSGEDPVALAANQLGLTLLK